MNSAIRIVKLFEKLSTQRNNNATLSNALCNIFNFTSNDITEQNHFALSKLIMIRKELMTARDKIKASNKIQPVRYEENFKKLLETMNSRILNEHWVNYLNGFPVGLFNVIGICVLQLFPFQEKVNADLP